MIKIVTWYVANETLFFSLVQSVEGGLKPLTPSLQTQLYDSWVMFTLTIMGNGEFEVVEN